MVGTAAVDLNRVLASRRAPADHRCEPTRSEPPALSRTFSGGPWCCRVAKHIAAAPHCFDVMIAAGCLGELFAQIADKNIDDLELRRVHPVVEVIEKHLLGHNGALVHAEQLEDRVFLAVTRTGLSCTETTRVLRSTTSSPVRIVDCRLRADPRIPRAADTSSATVGRRIVRGLRVNLAFIRHGRCVA